MSRIRLALVLALLVPTAASAQGGGDAPPRAPAEVRPVGEYSGVDGADDGAKVQIGKRGKHPRVLWVGFRAREDGGATLFVQLDRDVAASQIVEGGKLIISLGDARPVTRNTIRWLDTRFFDSAVARVEAGKQRRGKKKARKAGLELVVSFKEGAAPVEGSMSSSQGKDGLTYLSFDFPSAK